MYYKDYQDKYRTENKEAIKDKKRAYNKTDRGRYMTKLRNLRVFKLTEDIYRAMVEDQRNCCAICGVFFTSEDSKTAPHIDHDHDTGTVRALLCRDCNVGIGFLKDRSEVCMRATTYLMSYGS